MNFGDVPEVKMSEYWVISAPGDKTCQQTWDTLNEATKAGNLSANYKFPIPDLKVTSFFKYYWFLIILRLCQVTKLVDFF